MSACGKLSQSSVGALLGALLSCLTPACDDSLKSVSLIEETRVLGARVEVASDATRSSPQPGEQASLRLFLAAPVEPAQVSYTLSVCAVSPVNTGFPSCASAPFASVQQAQPTSSEPALDFRVPADLDLIATPHALASAFVCPDGPLSVDENDRPNCGNGAGTAVNFEFDLGGPDYANHSPSITADALTWDDAPWPEAPESATCDDLRAVSAGSTHTLAITIPDADFEALTQSTSLEPARETLLVSQFSSSGQLSHAFLSLSEDTAPADRRVTWQAPKVSAAEPTLARFYFVVRDARGGEDFATRAVCVHP